MYLAYGTFTQPTSASGRKGLFISTLLLIRLPRHVHQAPRCLPGQQGSSLQEVWPAWSYHTTCLVFLPSTCRKRWLLAQLFRLRRGTRAEYPAPQSLTESASDTFPSVAAGSVPRITASSIRDRRASAIWSGGWPRPSARLVPFSARAIVSLRPEQLSKRKRVIHLFDADRLHDSGSLPFLWLHSFLLSHTEGKGWHSVTNLRAILYAGQPSSIFPGLLGGTELSSQGHWFPLRNSYLARILSLGWACFLWP